MRCPIGKTCNFLHLFRNPLRKYEVKIDNKRPENKNFNFKKSLDADKLKRFL